MPAAMAENLKRLTANSPNRGGVSSLMGGRVQVPLGEATKVRMCDVSCVTCLSILYSSLFKRWARFLFLPRPPLALPIQDGGRRHPEVSQ